MMVKVKPAKGLLITALALVVTGLVAAIWTDLQIIWYGLLIYLLVVAVYDLFLLSRITTPEVERIAPSAMAVGNWHNIDLRVDNLSSNNIQLQLFDHFPETVQYKNLPQVLVLEKKQQAVVEYQCRPLQRGEMVFSKCQCLIDSRYGFWRSKRDIDITSSIRVYPNYAPVIEYALLATENHLSLMGILKNRRRGQGMDFHQLREFREGDSLKQIDWKASSRMNKIIAREYQDERDQEILILMDCGHRMLAQDSELSHFDHSLNALLLLSYVALRQGDAVGVATFSHEDARWIKPIKGVANINLLLNGIYDLQPSSQAPDYSTGAKNLLLRHRKRSLVIILTNLRDDDAEDLQVAVQLLQKHHRVVVASLQEQALHDVLEKDVYKLEDALTLAAAHAYLNKRQQLIKVLQKRGVRILDVLPEKLPLALTNCYLDLKVSGQL
ncbi:MAG: DUF58 domain-containing protein [Gammaproteobacteria bacterium]|nr:DUF58 domain-containing protein [Gammaproteobacteria bacterium]